MQAATSPAAWARFMQLATAVLRIPTARTMAAVAANTAEIVLTQDGSYMCRMASPGCATAILLFSESENGVRATALRLASKRYREAVWT